MNNHQSHQGSVLSPFDFKLLNPTQHMVKKVKHNSASEVHMWKQCIADCQIANGRNKMNRPFIKLRLALVREVGRDY
jgi:hypothetical protein